MYALYVLYRIIVFCLLASWWLLYWFGVAVIVTVMALWKLAVAVFRLLVSIGKAEVEKPSIKAGPGPRDYNLPQ